MAYQFKISLRDSNPLIWRTLIVPETIDHSLETIATCNVPKGGIMIMKPLLLHSSGRTTNQQKRRVIHLEFSNQQLPEGLQWAEKQAI